MSGLSSYNQLLSDIDYDDFDKLAGMSDLEMSNFVSLIRSLVPAADQVQQILVAVDRLRTGQDSVRRFEQQALENHISDAAEDSKEDSSALITSSICPSATSGSMPESSDGETKSRSNPADLTSHFTPCHNAMTSRVRVGTKRKRAKTLNVVNIEEVLPRSVSLSPAIPTVELGSVIELEALELAYMDEDATTSSSSSFLYVRFETMLELEFIASHPRAFVYGPPGAGKSVVAWLYAILKAKGKGKRVLWRYRDKNGNFQTSQITKDKVTRLGLISELPPADILITDGQSSHTAAVESWLLAAAAAADGGRRQVVYVATSGQFKSPPNDFDVHEVMSWTESEYREALKHRSIRARVVKNFDRTPDPDGNEEENDGAREGKANTFIAEWDFQAKYFLAGGNCRLMFHKSPKQAIEFLEDAMSQVAGVEAALTAGLRGDHLQGRRVNSLLQVTKPNQYALSLDEDLPEDEDDAPCVFVVSEFAMRQLSAKVQEEFVHRAYQLCINNPWFDGWVLGLDFLVRIQQAGVLTLQGNEDDQSPTAVWPHIGKWTFFSNVEEIKSLKKSQWLIPKLRKQGGYDAVRVEVGEEEAIINVTFMQVSRTQGVINTRYMDQMEQRINSLRGEKTLISSWLSFCDFS